MLTVNIGRAGCQMLPSFACHALKLPQIYKMTGKDIWHRISIQMLLFRATLPSRQNGGRNRNKVYSLSLNRIIFRPKPEGKTSNIRLLLLAT